MESNQKHFQTKNMEISTCIYTQRMIQFSLSLSTHRISAYVYIYIYACEITKYIKNYNKNYLKNYLNKVIIKF